MTDKSVLIVVFTLNEQKNIAALLNCICQYSPDSDLLVVDDNSDDGTIEIVRSLNYEKVNLMIRSGPSGRGLSELDAIEYAQANNYEFMLEMDADFSHDPQDIPNLLEYKDKDLVIGSRYVEGGRIEGRPFYRNLITRIAHVYIRTMLSLHNIKDCTSGFRLYKTKLFENLDLESIKGVGPSVILGILYLCRNKRIKEVPVIFKDRKYGISKLNLSILMKSLLYCLKLRFSSWNKKRK